MRLKACAMKFELHIPITSNEINALDSIAANCDLSKEKIKKAVEKGALWLTKGKRTNRYRRIKKTLNPLDTLHFYYDERVLNQTCKDAILMADKQAYSVWYKPYGMLSQGSKWSEHLTITRFVQQYFNSERSVFLVHRLDRAASGLIVVAHTKTMARAFSQIFEHHKLKKHYQIIVHGDHRQHSQPEAITIPIDEKPSCSHFTLSEYSEALNLSLLDVEIETGRKHQIRKHAANIDLPVVGDRLYGNKSNNYPDELNLQLCAVELDFECPINGEAVNIKLNEELRPSISSISTMLGQ